MVTLNNSMEIAQVLDNKKALLVLHIGPQFERQLNAGQMVPVQVLVDGRNSNMAGAASGYASSMIEAFTRTGCASGESLVRQSPFPAGPGSTRIWKPAGTLYQACSRFSPLFRLYC